MKKQGFYSINGFAVSIFAVLICMIFIQCNSTTTSPAEELSTTEKNNFSHSISSSKKPWTHTNFDSSKFSFAIFGDLNGGERERIFDVAVAQLNLLRPDMIINVGDLIHGGTHNKDTLHGYWDNFDTRAQKAKAPIFYVAGNHDLANRSMWSVWDERYGEKYYHFVYNNVLFLVLNSEDHTPERMDEIEAMANEATERAKIEGWDILPHTGYGQMPEQDAGNIGETQASYFEKAIAENPNVLHTFIFVHKAPWKKEDPNFLRIETALENQPYTVFNGHVHAYDYEKRKGRDYIRLATTGGVQLPEKGRSMDHLTFVNVDQEGVTIANLLMAGILDKKGNIPKNGNDLCFEKTTCN